MPRDTLLSGWRFEDSAFSDVDWGCGYPSDVNTKRWMRDNLEPVFGWPNICRFSWGPATEVLEKRGRRLRSIYRSIERSPAQLQPLRLRRLPGRPCDLPGEEGQKGGAGRAGFVRPDRPGLRRRRASLTRKATTCRAPYQPGRPRYHLLILPARNPQNHGVHSVRWADDAEDPAQAQQRQQMAQFLGAKKQKVERHSFFASAMLEPVEAW